MTSPWLKTARTSRLKRNIAERTVKWLASDKVSFLWDTEIVIAYVNTEYNKWYALTDHTVEDMLDISEWFGGYLQTLERKGDGEE